MSLILFIMSFCIFSIFSFSKTTAEEERIVDVTRCILNNNELNIIAFSKYSFPKNLKEDSSYYFDEDYFQVTHYKTNRKYSIKLNGPEYDDAEIRIINHTSHLNFPYPIFEVISVGGSDVTTHEFIGLENDSLRHLFELTRLIPNTLKRKDAKTITGLVLERDELVYNFYDYPFEVSTDDFSIDFIEPEIVDILWDSFALHSFEGYRILESGKRVKYKVKKGTKLYIESLDRKNQLVKITIKKQTIFVPFKDINNKVQGNGAG